MNPRSILFSLGYSEKRKDNYCHGYSTFYIISDDSVKFYGSLPNMYNIEEIIMPDDNLFKIASKVKDLPNYMAQTLIPNYINQHCNFRSQIDPTLRKFGINTCSNMQRFHKCKSFRDFYTLNNIQFNFKYSIVTDSIVLSLGDKRIDLTYIDINQLVEEILY